MNDLPEHPLLARLRAATGRPALDAAGLDAFLGEAGDGVVFCGGDPFRYPECLDVAVVLPELLAAFAGRLRAAVAAPGLEAALQARYGFQRWPSLVFLRDGEYVGILSGMLDWPVYLARIGELLAAPASRPPSIGVAVAAPAAAASHRTREDPIMKPFSIPVVAAGPGSQPGESLHYLTLPQGMHTYRPPSLPEPEESAGMLPARAVLDALLRALAAPPPDGATHAVDLAGLDAANLRLLDRVLGEGEVSAQVGLEAGRAEVQESLYAGVWRVREFDAAGRPLADRIEVGGVPAAVRRAGLGGRREMPAAPADAAGLMSGPALLAEIGAALEQGTEHVMNLSLLPYSPADGEWLDAALGRGRVSLLSRGYGNCRITATALARVWWVQYFNSMDAMILNTLEVTDMPQVALAAAEDLEDSAARLAEVVDWLG